MTLFAPMQIQDDPVGIYLDAERAAQIHEDIMRACGYLETAGRPDLATPLWVAAKNLARSSASDPCVLHVVIKALGDAT